MIAATFFLVHPIHTDAVNQIHARADLLYTLFFILSLIFYHQTINYQTFSEHRTQNPEPRLRDQSAVETQNFVSVQQLSNYQIIKLPNYQIIPTINYQRRYYYLSLLSFILSLLSKESAVVLPLILFLYEWCQTSTERPKIYVGAGNEAIASQVTNQTSTGCPKTYVGSSFTTRTIIFRQIPFYVILAGYLFFRFFILHLSSQRGVLFGGNILTTLSTMSKITVIYIKLLIFPLNLCADYSSFPLSHSFLEPTVMSSVGILTIIIIIAIRLYRISTIFTFSILWFFITLLPASNLIPATTLMAEKFLYLPAVGFIIFSTKLIDLGFKKLSVYFLYVDLRKSILTLGIYSSLLFVFLVLFAIRTFLRNKDWHDSFLLWSKTVQCAPDSVIAHNNFGRVCYEKKMYNAAVSEFKKALKLSPDYGLIQHNIADAYGMQGRYDKALEILLKIYSQSPNNHKILFKIAFAYEKQGMLNEALVWYEKLLKLFPNSAVVQKKLQELSTQK